MLKKAARKVVEWPVPRITLGFQRKILRTLNVEEEIIADMEILKWMDFILGHREFSSNRVWDSLIMIFMMNMIISIVFFGMSPILGFLILFAIHMVFLNIPDDPFRMISIFHTAPIHDKALILYKMIKSFQNGIMIGIIVSLITLQYVFVLVGWQGVLVYVSLLIFFPLFMLSSSMLCTMAYHWLQQTYTCYQINSPKDEKRHKYAGYLLKLLFVIPPLLSLTVFSLGHPLLAYYLFIYSPAYGAIFFIPFLTYHLLILSSPVPLILVSSLFSGLCLWLFPGWIQRRMKYSIYRHVPTEYQLGKAMESVLVHQESMEEEVDQKLTSPGGLVTSSDIEANARTNLFKAETLAHFQFKADEASLESKDTLDGLKKFSPSMQLFLFLIFPPLLYLFGIIIIFMYLMVYGVFFLPQYISTFYRYRSLSVQTRYLRELPFDPDMLEKIFLKLQVRRILHFMVKNVLVIIIPGLLALYTISSLGYKVNFHAFCIIIFLVIPVFYIIVSNMTHLFNRTFKDYRGGFIAGLIIFLMTLLWVLIAFFLITVLSIVIYFMEPDLTSYLLLFGFMIGLFILSWNPIRLKEDLLEITRPRISYRYQLQHVLTVVFVVIGIILVSGHASYKASNSGGRFPSDDRSTSLAGFYTNIEFTFDNDLVIEEKLTFLNCTIKFDDPLDRELGIYVREHATLNLIDTDIRSNDHISMKVYGTLFLERSSIDGLYGTVLNMGDPFSVEFPAGILCRDAIVRIFNSTLSDAKSDCIKAYGSEIDIRNTTIDGSLHDGVKVIDSKLHADNCTIRKTDTAFVAYNSTGSIYNCTLEKNGNDIEEGPDSVIGTWNNTVTSGSQQYSPIFTVILVRIIQYELIALCSIIGGKYFYKKWLWHKLGKQYGICKKKKEKESWKLDFS